MASLTTTTTSKSDSSVLLDKDEKILDDILNNQTDDIAVEISPVEGYSEIKMLSSPFGGAMLSPGNEIHKNDTNNFCCSSPIDNSSSTTSIGSNSSTGNDNIPQWKKDLIQRRKSNIARTIGANQSLTCPKKGFLDTLESIKQQKPEDDTTKVSTTTNLKSPVSPLTKSNLYVLKSPNNSNNSSINSNSLDDDSNSSEYLDINLHGSPRQQQLQPANNYVKSTIKTQHKQEYNYHQYDDNNDHDDDVKNDHNIDDNIQIEETGISGGQYTINNIKKINNSGNTIIKSPQQHQTTTTTTSPTNNIQQNFSIPKQKNILNNQINNSPTGETSLLTTEQLNNKNLSTISNNSSVCSETTSNISDIKSSNICSNDEQKHQQQQQQQLNKSSMTSSSLSGTSSIQLHSKHDTVKSLNIASSSTSNLKTVGLTNNLINNQILNKKCGIVTINSQTINKNYNKFIKNTQNSCNQKNKIIKKMVAAQDLNESSSATTTNQTQPTIIIDDNDSTSSQFNDFDSSEELQYGPGIVSKLRVRYLSLALRQTTGKQRTPNNLDNLRRATSLNNLLDGGGSTGSTNDGSIIDGDIDNDINHHHQQNQILNHITQHQQQQNNQNQQQNNKIHKNVSWLNDQNSNNFIKKYIEINDDDDDIENSKEFDIEITKNNDGKYNKKPENIYKTGINNYQQQQQNKKDEQIHQQKHRNGRQVKRGNDSLKRARSVEALLCEKSSWLNNGNNKNSNSICGKMSISSCDSNEIGVGEILLVTEKPDSNEINLVGNKNLINQQKFNTKTGAGIHHIVTIEDKIINARERLHNNTEKQSPPKRLTSIIDDTERPPPDLVKQTLKLFEATAHRRNGRNLSRNTQNNQVAVKIANYKSIISQEKPIIQYPKPPLSPKRNNLMANKKPPTTLDLKTKTNVTEKSNSPINSPVSSLTRKFSGIDVNNELDLNNKLKSSSPLTPPQILPRNKLQNKNTDDNAISFQRTPDLIPRKHFDNLNHNQTTNVVDSPITQLTNKINSLKIQNSPITPTSSSSATIDSKNHLTAKSVDELTNDTDSLTSDDDTDGCDKIKRISKIALENISKAGTTQHFSFKNSSSKNDHLNNSTQAKQVGIIRPLPAEPKKDNSSILVANSSSNGATCLDNIKPQRDNLVISNLNQTKNQFNNNNSTSKMKFIENSGSVIDKPALTTREIEKNLINEKKNELANLETNNLNDVVSSSPIWQLNKKIKNGSISGGQPIETQNNIMVFNFQDRKDVPDYIENDGLLIKRRRELPKPNESGFVLLGDLTLETSTDPDESWTMGPPSPCNVEFENANIIIDGKSNLRYRSKEISLRVQFDDTLTSTFEYPSESSFLDDSIVPTVETFSNTIDSLEHIDADEIIQIPNNTSPTLQSPSTVTAGQKSLGNMSLGSAPLGSYTPIKAQIQTNFELGITRVPNNSNQMNGNSLNDNQQSNGISKDIINTTNNCSENKLENKILTTTTDDTATNNANDIITIDKITEPESLQYLKPATDDLTVVYSEGTQETDLLY